MAASSGADAIPELLRLFPVSAGGAPVRDPRVLPLARRIYARIAIRRHCLVRSIPVARFAEEKNVCDDCSAQC